MSSDSELKRDDRRSHRDEKRGRSRSHKNERQIVLQLTNLTSRNVKESHLEEIFNHFGDVKSVKIPKSREEGKAFIKYGNNEAAEKGYLFMNKGQIDGCAIYIEKVYQVEKGQRGGREKGREERGRDYKDRGGRGRDRERGDRRLRSDRHTRGERDHDRKKLTITKRSDRRRGYNDRDTRGGKYGRGDKRSDRRGDRYDNARVGRGRGGGRGDRDRGKRLKGSYSRSRSRGR